MNNRRINNNLKFIRESHSLHPGQVAQITGTQRRYVEGFEDGTLSVPLSYLENFCDFFCIPIESVLNDDLRHMINDAPTWIDEAYKKLTMQQHITAQEVHKLEMLNVEIANKVFSMLNYATTIKPQKNKKEGGK